MDTLLILNMHHIISDEWSNKIFLKEIKMFYQIFLNLFSNNIIKYSYTYLTFNNNNHIITINQIKNKI